MDREVAQRRLNESFWPWHLLTWHQPPATLSLKPVWYALEFSTEHRLLCLAWLMARCFNSFSTQRPNKGQNPGLQGSARSFLNKGTTMNAKICGGFRCLSPIPLVIAYVILGIFILVSCQKLSNSVKLHN